MDIGVIRGLLTLALMLAFLALVVSVWSRRRTAEFESAARLPLEESPAVTSQAAPSTRE